MQTPLGNLLRHYADLADRGECGIDAATLQKTVELHLLDHQRINILSDMVMSMRKKAKKCIIVHLNPNRNGSQK